MVVTVLLVPKIGEKLRKTNAETIIQFVQVRRCPDDIDEDQWKALVKYWKFSEGQNLSEKNKISHEMKKTTHIAGTKSYARWSEDMPHRAKIYLATHRKRRKGINEPVVELEIS